MKAGDHLVWMSSNGKAFPRKITADSCGASTGTVVGGPFMLSTEEMALPLNELAERYPMPSHSGEVLSPQTGIWAWL